MTKYKGLSVPNIVKEHIDISEVFNTNCVLTKFSSVGDSGHYQRPDSAVGDFAAVDRSGCQG